MTAAEDLARQIRERVPTWTEEATEPGLWKWTDPDDDYDRFVVVDGRERELRVLPPMDGKHLGPSLIGFNHETTVRVDLPSMVDSYDRRAALKALEVFDALPAVKERHDA